MPSPSTPRHAPLGRPAPGFPATDPPGAGAKASRPARGRVRHRRVFLFPALLLIVAAALPAGCGYEERVEQPPYVETVELSGTPYEMGFQSGKFFSSKIRSFYTQLLTTALLPWLNRQQPDIESVLKEYAKPLYDNGQFSYQVLLQSGENLLKDMPQDYQEEMQGVADGAGLPFEQILVLNTLLDSMLNMRAITFLIQLIQAPQLLGVQFFAPADSVPGGGDSGAIAQAGLAPGVGASGAAGSAPGEVAYAATIPAGSAPGVGASGAAVSVFREGADPALLAAGTGMEPDEDGEVKVGTIWPYNPSPYASLVEMPVNSKIRFTLEDVDGVDASSVRIQLNRQIILAGDPSIKTRTAGKNGKRLEVDFQPPGGLPPASVVSVQIQAGDLTWTTDPPPGHARIMRDERIIFTTQGYGKQKWEVENRGEVDDRTQPPPVGFAMRNSATTSGKTIAAHHFALLDSGTSHKHNALMIRRPKEGKPHAMMGWAGLVYGFSGINSDGLVFMAHISDTLNNSMVGQVLEDLKQGHFTDAKLLASGMLIGIEGREILTRTSNVQEALDLVKTQPQNYGWNMLLAEGNRADRGQSRTLAAVEVDSDILHDADKGFFSYMPDPACSDPANCDSHGRPWASVGPDDLRIAAHYLRNTEDINIDLFGYPFIEPQRFWTTYYFRSLRGFYLMEDQFRAAYGLVDVPLIERVMRINDFVDRRDSMNAMIYEPEDMRLHVAAGQVPATDGPFITVDLSSVLAEGGNP
jgi:hypothetical protein